VVHSARDALARMGQQQAARAITHTRRVIVSHLLALGTCDEEARSDQWNPRQEARARQRARKALERLGDTVTVEGAASEPGGERLSSQKTAPHAEAQEVISLYLSHTSCAPGRRG